MQSPLVSCLVTAYNYERFLERAVESALAQDVDSLEVVIVNDGSTDGTGAVADALAARHPERVRVIHKENGGWISAVNVAIDAARGRYLGILDADDTWLPGKLRAQLDVLEARPEVGLVYSDLRLIDEHDATLEESFWTTRNVVPFEGAAAAGLVTVGNCVPTSTILVRAALEDAFFPLPTDVPYGDWWIGFRTATVAEIVPLRTPTVGYRQHGKNLTLDVQGDALVRELRKEHLFRRIALGSLEPGVMTVAETVRAYGALEASAHVVRSAAGTAFARLADPKPAEAEAELALADAALPLAALRHRLRAVALDPWNEEARSAFLASAQELADRPHDREAAVAPAPEDEFLALGFLDELVDRPDMLADYVQAFDGDENARLVLLAPGQDPEELGTAMEPIAKALGLDRDSSAEVVIVTAEGAGEELAAKAAAVYTREYRNSYLTNVPQTGAIDELIRMARKQQPVAVGVAAQEPDVLAIGFLEEIAASPELLEDFARTFDGRRDTRLVLLAPEFAGSEDELSRALEGFASAMGLDRDESADVVVLTDPAAEAELAPRAQAVYSRVPRGGSLAGLPHVDRAHALTDLTAVAPPAPSIHVTALLEAAPPWAAESLPPETVPGMITDEEKRYFRWVGKGYTGAGAVVELGPWLGCSTHHIVAGLSHTAAFEKLHVYDDFVWRSDWMDGYYEQPDRPVNHGDFKFIFDRYAAPIADRIVAEKRKFVDYDGNQALPQLEWNGGAIEIVYIDCGRTIEANEAWWKIFSPHFVAGKTLVIMQDWQLWKEQPPQWYNQTKEFTDSKGAALELLHELRDGAVGAFLYRGETPAPAAAVAADAPAWHRTASPEGIERDRLDNEAIAALIAATLRPDSSTLDIGSHWGTVLEELEAAAPHGHHIAYEPLPHLADEVRRRHPHADVRCAAASDRDGSATFVHVTELEGYSGFKAHPNAAGEAQREIEVRTVRLDDDLPAGFTPDFVKIDVEGAELQVLEGMRETLRRARPTVVFEHGGASRQYGTASEHVFDLLAACGLEIHDLDGGGPYTLEAFGDAAMNGRYWNWVAKPAAVQPTTGSGWQQLVADRPQLHDGVPTSWSNPSPAVVERFLRPGMRTLETGAGYSTVVFAAAGCEHAAVTPAQGEADRIAAYCRAHGFPVPTFHVGRSDDVLPGLDGPPLDAVLIDGAHAFPHPIVDWHHLDRRLKVEGLLFLDDTHLLGVFLLDRYLARDGRWREVHREGTLAVYEKLGADDGSHDLLGAQPISREPVTDARSFLAGIWPEALDELGLATTTGRAVLVAGMHRSGTSAVARVVDLLGASVGPEAGLVPPAEDNPTGFWESRALVDLNEAVLAARGGSWCDVPAGADEEVPAALLAQAKSLVATAGAEGDWTWKDPRTCLTLPFWRRALDREPVVVLPFRNPLEVWRSLEARNGIDKELALALWERYVRRALAGAAGLPVFVLPYEALLRDPKVAASRLADFLAANGLQVVGDVADAVRDFVDEGLRHASYAASDLAVDETVSAAQVTLYETLEALVGPHASFAPPALPPETPTTESLLERKRQLDRAYA